MAITPGMHGGATITVDQSHTAAAHGVGNLPILSTPALVALVERAAVNAVRRGLEPGEETFGTAISLQRRAPTSIGKQIRAQAEVVEVADRRIRLTVQASDSSGVIAEGTHERAIVDRDQFIWQAAARGA
ncbi:MAG TPA: thioesterase [Chloroflexota bacterium]|nr:thioesterase [Chloroflexota bacterium]